MKIREKLLSGYVLIALLAALIGVAGIYVADSFDRELTDVADDTMPELAVLQNLRYAGLRIVTSTLEYLFISEQQRSSGFIRPKRLQQERELIDESVSLYRDGLAYYAAMDPPQGRHDRVDVPRIRKAGNDLRQESAALVVAMDRRESHAVILARKERLEQAEQEYLAVLGTTMRREQTEFAAARERLRQRAEMVKLQIVLVTSLSFVVALLAGVFMANSISRRIRRLKDAAVRIGDGDLDARVESHAADELGELVNSFNAMAGELKRSRDEVTSARDNLGDIIHSMMDALIVAGPDGSVERVNMAACSLLGYDEEPVGIPLDRIIPESPYEDLAVQGMISDAEKIYLAKDGRQIPVAFSGAVMWNADGSMRGIVCVARDISERKKAEERLRRFTEELQETNEDLRSFAYIASHDLRSPLVNIRGFSGELTTLLAELNRYVEPVATELPPATRERAAAIISDEIPEALEFIRSSVNRMDALTGAILKLSRLGHRELVSEPVDMDALLKRLVKSSSHQMETRQVRVRVEPLPELVSDRLALEQIFANLLDNAIKFSLPERPGQVCISAVREGGRVLFAIRDNGRGIGEDDREKVFEIFRRAGHHDVPGEGMGLAYVKALVRRLNGQIWFESTLGEGTTFYVSLPDAQGLWLNDIKSFL